MRTVLFAACLFFTFNLTAQTGAKELGIRFTSLDRYDLLYKKEVGENTYRRYGLAFLNISYINSDGFDAGSLNIGGSIGRERRRQLSDRVNFAHGLQLSLSGGIAGAGDNLQVFVTPGLGYLLGFQYNVSDQFYIGVEVIPETSFQLTFGEITTGALRAGLSTSGVGLTAVYRFFPIGR